MMKKSQIDEEEKSVSRSNMSDDRYDDTERGSDEDDDDEDVENAIKSEDLIVRMST